SRDQNLWKKWSLNVGLEGQAANHPLVTLEQFGIGGIATVRPYHEGESYGDLGWATQVELRAPSIKLGWIGRPRGLEANLSAFTDYGSTYYAEPVSGQNSQSLWGAGVGLRVLGLNSHFEGRLIAAWALKDSPTLKAGEERITFSVSAQF